MAKLFCLALVAGCATASHPPAAPPPAPPRPHYTMDVALTPSTHELRVTGDVRVHATGAPITLDLLASATDVALTSTPAGAWTQAPVADHADQLAHTLTVPAGEVTIHFAYASHQATGFVYFIGDEALLAGGPNTPWYPQLTDKGTATIALHYPTRYRLEAGGRAVDHDDGATRTTTVTYAQPATFSFVAAPLIEHARAGKVPMRALVTRDRPTLAAYLDGVSRALDVLVGEFGPYPYDSFALVELPDAITEAAGFWGASFEGFMVASSSNLDAPFNLAYFGHELGHQWWGNDVTLDGDAGGMLTDEGLAQFGSLCVVETIEGDAAAEAYRRRGYPGYNNDQSGLGYLRYAAAGLDLPVSAPIGPHSALMHQLANSKGLLALDHLARVVGRDVFRAALHDVTQRYAFRAMPWRALRERVEAHAGRDLGTVFAQWFERAGAPDLALTWTHGQGEIVQHGTPYALAIDVAVIGAHDRHIQTVTLTGERTTFAIATPFDRLELDPHYTVLHWTPEYRAEAEAFADCTRAYEKRAEGDLPAAAALFQTALDRAPPPAADRYGVRFLIELGFGRLLQRQGDRVAARAHLLAAVAAPSPAPEHLPRAYLYLAELAADDHDRDAVQRFARAATDAEAAGGHPIGIAAAVAQLIAR